MSIHNLLSTLFFMFPFAVSLTLFSVEFFCCCTFSCFKYFYHSIIASHLFLKSKDKKKNCNVLFCTVFFWKILLGEKKTVTYCCVLRVLQFLLHMVSISMECTNKMCFSVWSIHNGQDHWPLCSMLWFDPIEYW